MSMRVIPNIRHVTFIRQHFLHLRDVRCRINFVFEKTEIMSDLEMRYFKRDAKVDALTFGDNVKSLKSLCHNVKKIGSIAE